MKRLLCGLVLVAGLSSLAFGQEARPREQHSEEQGGDKMMGWKLINFAILAFILGYFAAKKMPAVFQARTDEIRLGIEQAAKMKAEAEAKVAGMERQMAELGAEIEKLRAQLKSEMVSEGERLKQESARMVKRIHDQAQQEISFMTKAGRQELKKYSAALAIDLAAQRIQSRMNPETQHSLVESFVRDLNGSGHEGDQA